MSTKKGGKKSDNWDPRCYGKWEDIEHCGCGTDNYVGEKFIWCEVPMMRNDSKQAINTWRWIGGILTLGKCMFLKFEHLNFNTLSNFQKKIFFKLLRNFLEKKSKKGKLI